MITFRKHKASKNNLLATYAIKPLGRVCFCEQNLAIIHADMHIKGLQQHGRCVLSGYSTNVATRFIIYTTV